ncbi:MAG: RNA 2',3'-cyclic phosphodiesterase [Nanoarchaeota archaeon]|nr:RNA 2',3'-cyclic phosphodiesterase [Nanoarchaeota archaeon]
MKLFISIVLPKNVLEHLASIQKHFSNLRMSMSPVEKMHITLRYLGECDLDYVKRGIEKARFQPFRLILNKAGIFDKGSNGILWVSLHPSEDLIKLRESVNASVPKITTREHEGTDYNPHITIAKFGNIRDQVLQIIPEIKVQPLVIDVNSIEIMHSKTTPFGSKYESVGIYPARH